MRPQKTLLILAVLVSGCSLTQAIDQGTRTMSSALVDEIARATKRPPDQPPPQQQPQQAQQQPAQARAVQTTVASATIPAGRQTGALFAVLDFKNRIKGKDADSVDSVYFANQVRAAVKKTAPHARVMTRENVMVLLQSQGKSLSDCEGECEVDTGRNLGADMVVSGDLIKIGGTWKLDLRLHQTSDGQLLSGAAASGKSPDDLDLDAGRAVADLLAPLP